MDHTRHTDDVARAACMAGLGGIALVHLLDLPDKMEETPWQGWLFVGLMGVCVISAGLLLTKRTKLAWVLAGTAATATIIAFCISRTSGLFGADDDIGNWSEGLGLASLFAEGSVVLLSLYALLPARRPAEATSAAPAMTSVPAL